MILDIVMPYVDGTQVIATLRNDPRTAAIKVIGIHGKGVAADKLRFMRRRVDAFFSKPFNVPALVEKAGHLLAVNAAPQPA
jgi:CheY-like chemotaxis protein